MGIKKHLEKIAGYLRQEGARSVLLRAVDYCRNPDHPFYERWVRRFGTLGAAERQAIRRQIAGMEKPPLISIVMPVYDAPERWLVRAIESVRAQLYPHWELCIADDASTQGHVRPVLERCAALDQRIKVVYRDRNGHISAASNSALQLATGEYVALLDQDDELAEDALYHVAAAIDANPKLGMIYTDEDKINEQGHRFGPHFKSDWNPDLFLSQNMVCHLGVFRARLVREIGGFREGFEGSQDYDLALRVSEKLCPDQIRHIPRVLYHWRAIPGSTALALGEKSYAVSAAKRALESHLSRTEREGEVLYAGSEYHRVVYALPAAPGEVSVVVRVGGDGQDVKNRLERLLQTTRYEPLQWKLLAPEGQLQAVRSAVAGLDRSRDIQVLASDDQNAAGLNCAAGECRGEYLLFLDGALEPLSGDWLREMAAHAARPEVGAVGAKLLYGDDTVQHGGFLLGVGEDFPPRIAASAFQGLPRSDSGYLGRAQLTQNFSAVSADCLLLRREVWQAAGGFDAENLPHAFYDVDLCLRLGEKGWRTVWTPHAQLRRR